MRAIRFSERVRSIEPSPTLAVTDRARELRAAGRDVIGLGAGEPDFDTPEHVRAAAVRAIERGATRYTAVDGTPELKQAICEKLSRENGLDYTPDQVIASTGAKQVLFNLVMAVVGPGDEVIIPGPYWVSYPAMTTIAGGIPVVVSAGIESGFRITPEQLEQAITKNSRLLFLNSPGNPTGAVYSRAELEALGEVLRSHPDLLIATDDIYEHVLWGDPPFCNLVMACPDLADRTLVVNGVSKAYAMTGWRLGYGAGPREWIAAMRKIQGQSTSNPTAVSQAAAVAALSGTREIILRMVRAFKERHDVVVSRLNEIEGVLCAPGAGTFYAFPDCSGVLSRFPGIDDDVQLAGEILDQAGVALVPGTAFGAPGHLRLSFATGLDTLNEALDRIRSFLR